MSEYSSFAFYYDMLTENVDYNKMCEYFDGIIKKYGNGGNILLDLACGTASLSFEFANKGYDVVAVDSSEEMLSEAMNKPHNQGNPIFLCQKMQELDMFGTVDAAVCSLDSINHLETKSDVEKTFEKISLFLNDNGLFIFDVNTLYKHSCVLAENTFIYDTENVYCVWQNEFDENSKKVKIELDFFEKADDGSYIRSFEGFDEFYYDDEFLSKTIEKNGMEIILKYDDFSEKKIDDKTERIVYVCRRKR